MGSFQDSEKATYRGRCVENGGTRNEAGNSNLMQTHFARRQAPVLGLDKRGALPERAEHL